MLPHKVLTHTRNLATHYTKTGCKWSACPSGTDVFKPGAREYNTLNPNSPYVCVCWPPMHVLVRTHAFPHVHTFLAPFPHRSPRVSSPQPARHRSTHSTFRYYPDDPTCCVTGTGFTLRERLVAAPSPYLDCSVRPCAATPVGMADVSWVCVLPSSMPPHTPHAHTRAHKPHTLHARTLMRALTVFAPFSFLYFRPY
jgi:hypothetical protein